MNVKRTIWFGAGSIAVATWLTASTAGPRSPAATAAPARAAQIDRSAAALRLEVERLHDRIGPTAVPTGRRDLFRFSTANRRPAAAVQWPAPAAPAATPIAPPAPPLKLIGIAEDVSADGAARTAIVSGLGDVFLVKPGDTIAGRIESKRCHPTRCS